LGSFVKISQLLNGFMSLSSIFVLLCLVCFVLFFFFAIYHAVFITVVCSMVFIAMVCSNKNYKPQFGIVMYPALFFLLCITFALKSFLI
jgi:hypothetical protein